MEQKQQHTMTRVQRNRCVMIFRRMYTRSWRYRGSDRKWARKHYVGRMRCRCSKQCNACQAALLSSGHGRLRLSLAALGVILLNLQVPTGTGTHAGTSLQNIQHASCTWRRSPKGSYAPTTSGDDSPPDTSIPFQTAKYLGFEAHA